MEQKTMHDWESDEVLVFDERGRLVGIIPHPKSGEPIGSGREKVYLAKVEEQARPAAA